MTYMTIAQMTEDGNLRKRLVACAGKEGVENPQLWVAEHIWEIVANQEFEDAYAYALGTGVEDPGGNEGVISDAVILAHVQPLILGEAAGT